MGFQFGRTDDLKESCARDACRHAQVAFARRTVCCSLAAMSVFLNLTAERARDFGVPGG